MQSIRSLDRVWHHSLPGKQAEQGGQFKGKNFKAAGCWLQGFEVA